MGKGIWDSQKNQKEVERNGQEGTLVAKAQFSYHFAKNPGHP